MFSKQWHSVSVFAKHRCHCKHIHKTRVLTQTAHTFKPFESTLEWDCKFEPCNPHSNYSNSYSNCSNSYSNCSNFHSNNSNFHSNTRTQRIGRAQYYYYLLSWADLAFHNFPPPYHITIAVLLRKLLQRTVSPAQGFMMAKYANDYKYCNK